MLLGFLSVTAGILMIYLAIVNLTVTDLINDMQAGKLHR